MANRQTMKDKPLIQYLIKVQGHQRVDAENGDIVIEIPANWKLTMSGVNPAHAGEAYCVRVYEGTALRAVFAGATGFRDLSIPFARKLTNETGAEWRVDGPTRFKGDIVTFVEKDD